MRGQHLIAAMIVIGVLAALFQPWGPQQPQPDPALVAGAWTGPHAWAGSWSFAGPPGTDNGEALRQLEPEHMMIGQPVTFPHWSDVHLPETTLTVRIP
jgi:hypothetical protein